MYISVLLLILKSNKSLNFSTLYYLYRSWIRICLCIPTSLPGSSFILSNLHQYNNDAVFFLKCISYIAITKMIFLKCKTTLKPLSIPIVSKILYLVYKTLQDCLIYLLLYLLLFTFIFSHKHLQCTHIVTCHFDFAHGIFA